jgi:hypothetical protein
VTRDSRTENVDFYDGAYGPTIRFSTWDPETLLRLRTVFEALATGEERSVDLVAIFLAHGEVVPPITVVAGRAGHGERQGLVREVSGDGMAMFSWRQIPPRWARCVDLVDGLVAYNKGSHQYLTEEGVDEALVTLAYCE